MIVLWIVVIITAIAIPVWIATKRLKPSFDTADAVHPECMACDEESCIGCPIIEAKVGRLK